MVNLIKGDLLLRLCNWGLNNVSSMYRPHLAEYQVRNYAARKGTREKAKKKKVKMEIKKIGFIPHNLRKTKMTVLAGSLRSNEQLKPAPVDNVYRARYYRWRVFSFAEAVQCHRETHHPTIYNHPTSPLLAHIELDMTTPKKTKFVESFSRMVMIPHGFPHGENRSVLVFVKDDNLREDAELAGASLVGGVDLIKKVEKGDIMLPDFEYVVAHPNILPELAALRGLLKRKFPSPARGTLGIDVGDLVKKLRKGIQYKALTYDSEQDYGSIETTFGTLNMDSQQLEENFIALLKDINSQKPKGMSTAFITRILLTSPPSVEKLKVNFDVYIEEEEQKKEDSESDSDEDVAVAIV